MEKRSRETRFLEAETVKLQCKLEELVRSRRKPAIHNANEKWKTRDASPDTEAAAASIVAASKSGEACSHQTQFVQDRRLSDSFDFGTSPQHLNKAVTLSVSDDETIPQYGNFEKFLLKTFCN